MSEGGHGGGVALGIHFQAHDEASERLRLALLGRVRVGVADVEMAARGAPTARPLRVARRSL